VAQAAAGRESPAQYGPGRTKDPIMATTVIGAHTLEHMYGRGFLVLIPAIYVALGLNPIQAGLIDGIRQLAGGATSMTGGFFVDIFQHRRAQVLTLSLMLIGVGYLLVSIAPTFGLILAALAIASAGTAMWHPPALGLLAQRFPARRGLFISMHRSTGNVGDWIGPLIVGVLLGGAAGAGDWWGSDWWPWEWSVNWRWIVGGGAPIMLTLSCAIFLLLRNVDGPPLPGVDYKQKIRTQLREMVASFRGTGMWSIFTVSAVRGMGDRSLLWVIPLYMSQDLGYSNFLVSFHVALFAVPGIFTGPLFGALSDRIGRKLITMVIMAATGAITLGIVILGDGWGLTAMVFLFGVFIFTVNSLTQAAAIDVAEGKGLEGTFIGLMWGSNAFFGAMASIAAGVLAEHYGWGSAFYLAAGLYFLGFAVSILMPGRRVRVGGG
jgi:FSR family fosmidomycin resistance protein-like MFS transporter